MSDPVQVAAPATVANVGPGFDVFGLALREPCDVVTARRVDEGVRIEGIGGDGGALPRGAGENSVGIAATAALARVRTRLGEDVGGVALRLEKGIPLASGMGSSAASAAAAVGAVDALFPGVLSLGERLEACLAAEVAVAGRHLDNVAAALLGGFVLVASTTPPRVHRIEPGFALHLAVVKPDVSFPTAESRAALPGAVPLEDMVAHLAGVAEMVHALHVGDRDAFLAGFVDRVLAPARGPRIPAFDEVCAAARDAGAEAVGISGGGPSVAALCPDARGARAVGDAMVAAFARAGHGARAFASALDPRGVRPV